VETKAGTPPEFPLDSLGRLLCRTCHRIHGGDPRNAYLLSDASVFPQRRRFCASCHEGGLASVSPHDASRGESRCLFCHTELASRTETEAPPLRDEKGKLCNFCHNTGDARHWEQLGLVSPLPKSINLGPDGKPACAVCHNAHGTASTAHFLRPSVARMIGRAQATNPHIPDRAACRSCHSKSFADDIKKATDYALLFGGDKISLCLSCHITGQRHHPIALTLPEEYKKRRLESSIPAPLDEKERITCYTCHDNQCAEGLQKMTVRGYSREQMKNDICWSCHDRKEFADRDPHSDNPDSCRWCHETRPQPGRSGGLIAGPSMTCLLCHEPAVHPAAADHLKKPSDNVKVDPSLPLNRYGAVSCVTCHSPHVKTNQLPGRLRRDPATICLLCHQR